MSVSLHIPQKTDLAKIIALEVMDSPVAKREMTYDEACTEAWDIWIRKPEGEREEAEERTIAEALKLAVKEEINKRTRFGGSVLRRCHIKRKPIFEEELANARMVTESGNSLPLGDANSENYTFYIKVRSDNLKKAADSLQLDLEFYDELNPLMIKHRETLAQAMRRLGLVKMAKAS